MKKYFMLSRINSKNIIVLYSLLIFVCAIILRSIFHINIFIYLSGFFVAFYLPGYAITNLIDTKKNALEAIMVAPVYTVFIFIPVFYLFTRLLGGQISTASCLAGVTIITLVSIFVTNKKVGIGTVDRDEGKYLIFGAVAFILFHAISTFLYKYIPEIDGYADIVRVETIVSTGIFNVSYRPLFTFLASYSSFISQIPPYLLFKFGFVFIQVTGVYYLYQFIKRVNINSVLLKYLILLIYISIPVISVEMDYVRPNIIFMLAVFPFVYYLSCGLEFNKKYLIVSTAIAGVGLFFHEFFVILFIINALFVGRYLLTNISKLKKVIVFVLLFFGLFVLVANAHQSAVLITMLDAVQKLIQTIRGGFHWTWWFLGTYSNADGNNLGWSGLGDVAKYYAYSLSPLLFIILLLYPVFFLRKILVNKTMFAAEKIAFALVVVGITFAEILPRINYPTLPDRFWPMISLSLLVLTPFFFSGIRYVLKIVPLAIIALLILVGVGGSLYITKAKGGYVSEGEHSAALWIKNNTSDDAIFITQGGNVPMIYYFARREIIVPQPSFFLNMNGLSGERDMLISKEIYDNAFVLFNNALMKPSNNNLILLNSEIFRYFNAVKNEKVIESIKDEKNNLSDFKNVYVLYSKEKFENYYAGRVWWRAANFYNADLNKFKNGFDLVYTDKEKIFIWKRK